MKACIQCNEMFKPKSLKQRFCSPVCREKSVVGNRFIIFQRDGFRCAYCGSTPMDDGIRLNLDHIIPKTKEGSHTAGNLITSCSKCNSTKSDRLLPAESLNYFLEYVSKANKENNIPDDRIIEGSHTGS